MMKKRPIIYLLFTVLVFAGVIFACKKKTGETGKPVITETETAGEVTLLVDNSIQPIVEDELAVFHSVYTRADIKQVNLTENAILQAMQTDTAKLVVVTRRLTPEEESHYTDSGIVPRATPFATDAVALIVNTSVTDSVINLKDIYTVLQGKDSGKVKNLIFDNANSSIAKFMLNKAGAPQLPQKGVYSQGSVEGVIKYVHDNPGAIGFVGVDWIVQAPPQLVKYVENIKVLSVNNVNKDGKEGYFKPNQTNIATGDYPLTRKLYVLNYQGKNGLGMGFANYISAPDGQRIVLKSGLLPEKIPTRDIQVRNKL